MDFGRYRKSGAVPPAAAATTKQQSSPPRMKQINLTPRREFGGVLDYVPIGERFGRAADELHRKMMSCRVVDVGIATAWLFLLIGPPLVYAVRSKAARSFGESPASAMLLLLLTSSAALTLCVVRIIASLQLESKRKTRIDRMANAPRVARHIAYVNEDSALAWWFWAGYVLAPFIYILDAALVLVWFFFVGITVLLAVTVLLLCLFSAVSTVKCTQWLYDKGIQRNFAFNIALSATYRDEWARFCANEKRQYWFNSEEV